MFELHWDFPGSSVVKNLPANAGDHWSRRIPHATEQLSPCATTMEPVLYSPGTTTTEPMHFNYLSLCNLEPEQCGQGGYPHCERGQTQCG